MREQHIMVVKYAGARRACVAASRAAQAQHRWNGGGDLEGIAILPLALLAAACAPTFDPSMGMPVSGAQFQDEIVGRVLSFRVPHGRLAQAQFQPDGTAVYSGRALDGIGRWRRWEKGYCAYYPWLGGGHGLRPPFSGRVEQDGYRCYEVRAENGYFVLFQPGGVYAGTLVPVPG